LSRGVAPDPATRTVRREKPDPARLRGKKMPLMSLMRFWTQNMQRVSVRQCCATASTYCNVFAPCKSSLQQLSIYLSSQTFKLLAQQRTHPFLGNVKSGSTRQGKVSQSRSTQYDDQDIPKLPGVGQENLTGPKADSAVNCQGP
jgi:hypothetical protein